MRPRQNGASLWPPLQGTSSCSRAPRTVRLLGCMMGAAGLVVKWDQGDFLVDRYISEQWGVIWKVVSCEASLLRELSLTII